MRHALLCTSRLNAAALVLLFALCAASSSFAATDAPPLCRGAGLPPDAPLYYLLSKKSRYKKGTDLHFPKLHDGERRPFRRRSIESIERTLAAEARAAQPSTTILYVVSLGKDGEYAIDGLPAMLFQKTDVNGDGLADLLYYEPAGSFYFIRLYAACGDEYFTPVAEFDSREIPEARTHVEVNGARWAEYVVIAPDPTSSHYAPLKNWARRTWQFDGTRYRQTAVEPLP
jgi:hypothetical protein